MGVRLEFLKSQSGEAGCKRLSTKFCARVGKVRRHPGDCVAYGGEAGLCRDCQRFARLWRGYGREG
jgi:hypothetical protein